LGDIEAASRKIKSDNTIAYLTTYYRSLWTGSRLKIREEMETQLIRSLIATSSTKVFNMWYRKLFMHFLVNHTAQHVQIRVVAALYMSDLFASMLNEDEALVAERLGTIEGSWTLSTRRSLNVLRFDISFINNK
jgi:hypothetical protein